MREKGRTGQEAGDHWCLCSVNYRKQRLKREVECAAEKLLSLGFLWWGRQLTSLPSKEQQRLATTTLVSNQKSKRDQPSLSELSGDPEMSPTTGPHHAGLMEKNLDEQFKDLKFIPENPRIYCVRIALGTCKTMNLSLICCQNLDKSPPLL